MSRAKQKGTAWETAIVRFLNENGAPHAERRALHGAADKGDIAGLGAVVVEAKAARTPQWGPWLKELADEIENAKAETGCLWIKRVGKSQAADGLVVITPALWLELLREAGYIK